MSKPCKVERALKRNFPLKIGRPSLVETLRDLSLSIEDACARAGHNYDKVCWFVANHPKFGYLTDYRKKINKRHH